MITHFLNPKNTEFTTCGIWSFVDSVDEIKTSSDTEGITCKNCRRTKIFIKEGIEDAFKTLINDETISEPLRKLYNEVRIICCNALDKAKSTINA